MYRVIILLTIVGFLFTYSCNNDNPSPKGEIKGKVTVAATQIPVEGVSISLSGAGTGSKVTGADGLFSFKELAIGSYGVSVGELPSFRSEATKTFEVRGNQSTNADIQLTPKGRIEGTITGAGTIDPILGASVQLTGGPAQVNLSKTTLNDGKYSFEALLDGSYELFVSHPDYASVKKEINITLGAVSTNDIGLSPGGPKIRISSRLLDFEVSIDTLSFEIANAGSEPLVWEIENDQLGLEFQPDFGTIINGDSPQKVIVSLDRCLFPIESRLEKFKISSNDLEENISVSFIVNSTNTTPIPDLKQSATSCFLPCNVEFDASATKHASHFEWGFGNGDSSVEVSPQYQYEESGNYTVNLAVSNLKCSTSLATSLQVDWLTFSKTFGGNANDFGYSIIRDGEDGYIFAGSSESMSNGRQDVYIVSTNLEGNVRWSSLIGGIGPDITYHIQPDSLGGYILAGKRKDPDTPISQILIVRINGDGEKIWEKTYGGAGDDVGRSVFPDNQGSFIVGGNRGTVGLGDFNLMKLDGNGVVIWDKVYGSEFDEVVNVMIETNDGGYVLGGGQANSSGYYHAFMIKVDSNGALIWEKSFKLGVKGDIRGLVEAKNGDLIVVGEENQDITGESDSDALFVRMDGNGNLIWDKSVGGINEEKLISVVENDSGDLIAVGWTDSRGSGGRDLMMRCLDGAGSLRWEKLYGGTSDERGFSITEAIDGGFAIVGMSESFGPSKPNVYFLKTDKYGNLE